MTTPDGMRLDGTWRMPAVQRASQLGVDVVIVHHGGGGNFYSPGMFEQYSDTLLEQGCAVLRVNNRGHDPMSRAVDGAVTGFYTYRTYPLTTGSGNVVYAIDPFTTLAPPPLPVSPDWSPVKHYGGYAALRVAAPGTKMHRPAHASLADHVHHRGATAHCWGLDPSGLWGGLCMFC